MFYYCFLLLLFVCILLEGTAAQGCILVPIKGHCIKPRVHKRSSKLFSKLGFT